MKGGKYVMKKSRLSKGLAAGMCVMMLAGCGVKDHGSDIQPPEKAHNEADQNIPSAEHAGSKAGSNTSAKGRFDELANTANIAGSVLEFSDTGCKISQLKTENGGESAYSAAPDSVTEDLTVSIQYGETCEFQIATINKTTGDYSAAEGTISDVKKESNLYVFGEFQDTHNLTATKVVITRYE